MELLKLLTASPLSPLKRLRGVIKRPVVYHILRYAGAAAAGFILAGARFLGAPLPAAVCLMAAMGCSLPSLLCYIGAVCGSFLLWNSTAMLLTLAAGFLTLVIHWAMQELPPSHHRLFLPLSVLFPGILAGGLLLVSEPLDGRSIFIFLVQMLFLPLGAVAAREVLKNPQGMPVCAALFAFVSGCGGILLPGGVSIGAILACAALLWLGGSSVVFPAAALTGLALDWSWCPSISCGAALTAAAVGAAIFSETQKGWRYGAFLLCIGGVIALTGGQGGTLFLAAVLGGGIFLLLPARPSGFGMMKTGRQQLILAADAMELLYRQMEDMPPPSEASDLCEVCRQAANRVCTHCVKYAVCWKSGGRTWNILQNSAPAFAARNAALPEDFPQSFQDSCLHFPDLLQGLNDALHSDADRRQRSHHRRELRSAIGGQYRILSDFLSNCQKERIGLPPPLYKVEAVCRQSTRRGAEQSGDRAICFQREELCYLLLCDGMGTGHQAAAASSRAVALLKSLLEAGMAADDALETLNAAAIVREDAGFSTVDLAEISLLSGEGTLYKWGGAASYLLSEDGAIKMGTASLPPGLGVGGTHQAQQIRLSLGRGEVLILVSDGIGGEAVETVIRQGESLSPSDLAAGIVLKGCSEGEDDGTAAVLRLLPVSAH